jgi:urease accessory protein
MQPAPAALAALAACAWPGPAWAHSLSARFGDFYGGLLHPATALEQALPLVALGLLAGQNGPRPARWLLLAVPIAFALGTSLGGVLPPPPYLWVINAGSFLLLGLLLAFDGALPLPLLLGLGAGLGLSHGLANGSGMAGGTDPPRYSCSAAPWQHSWQSFCRAPWSCRSSLPGSESRCASPAAGSPPSAP